MSEEIIESSENLKFSKDSNKKQSIKNSTNKLENNFSDSSVENKRKNNKNQDLIKFSKSSKELKESSKELKELKEKKKIPDSDFISFKKEEKEKSDNKETELELVEDLSYSYRQPIFPQFPWISKKTAEFKGMIKLHFEITDFYNYIKPHKSEYEIRMRSFDVLKQLLLKKFPDVRVKSFGSFPNEIFLADSDVDIVVISKTKSDQKKTLDKIYDYIIYKSELFDYVRKIDAKVPIIKLQLKETKIFLDISVDRKNGYDAKRIIKRSMNDFHALKPLLYVLKYLIRQKKLNETFTGGVSSFLLFNLVLAFLQYKNKTEISNFNQNSNQLNLGQLLVDFFQFYGFEFNYDEIGISVRYGGFFYKKKDKE